MRCSGKRPWWTTTRSHAASARVWARGHGPGDRQVAPTCCLLISHRDTENTGGGCFRAWARGRLPTRRPHPPLVPPSPRRGRGEMVRVRRVSGPHRPSPFAKGGGVGEGDSPPLAGPRRATAGHAATVRATAGLPLPAPCCSHTETRRTRGGCFRPCPHGRRARQRLAPTRYPPTSNTPTPSPLGPPFPS